MYKRKVFITRIKPKTKKYHKDEKKIFNKLLKLKPYMDIYVDGKKIKKNKIKLCNNNIKI